MLFQCCDNEFAHPIFVVRCPDVTHHSESGPCTMLFLFDEEGQLHSTRTMACFLSEWREDITDEDRCSGLSLSLRGGPLESEQPMPSSEEEELAKQLDKAQALAPIGGRVRMAYGSGTATDPILWYGGTVDHVNEDGARVIACDDGCVETYTLKDIVASSQAGGFEVLDASVGGVSCW